MRELTRLGLLGAVITASGCGVPTASVTDTETRPGVVSFGGVPADVSVMIGHSWPLDDDAANVLAVDKNGVFSAPLSARAATAFIDHNGNSRHDPFLEPSAWCELSDQWHCQLRDYMLKAHHTRARYDGGQPIDSIHLYAEAYSPLWTPDTMTTLCQVGGDCAEQHGVSYVGKKSHARSISACQHDWSEPMRLQFTSSRRDTLFVVSEPEPLDIIVDAKVGEQKSISITGRVGRDAERFLVWVGDVDPEGTVTKLRWNSEHQRVSASWRRKDFALTIPFSAVTDCGPDCRIGVQAIARTGNAADGVLVYSEGRVVIPLPQAAP